MKIAIIDDLQQERKDLLLYIEEWCQKNRQTVDCSEYVSGEAFLSQHKLEQPFDLIFLDIYMSQLNGVETLREIRKYDREVRVVFLTSSREHIYEAASLHFFDYVQKPCSLIAVTRILTEVADILASATPSLFLFEYRNLTVKIKMENIISVISQNHDTIFLTDEGEQRYRIPYAEIVTRLTDPRFLVCNRGITLNMDKIQSMEEDIFLMDNGLRYPIRRNGRKQITDRYIQYQFDRLEENL